MDGHVDLRAVYHGAVFHYDHECVRAVFPPVSVYRYRPDPFIIVCRGTEPERGEEFSEILCGGVS